MAQKRVWCVVATRRIVARMAPPLTSQQTADALGVHRSTVHKWVRAGLLTPAQVVHLDGREQGAKVYLFDAEYVERVAVAMARSA